MLIKPENTMNKFLNKKINIDLIYYFVSTIIIFFVFFYLSYDLPNIKLEKNLFSNSANELIILITVFLISVYAEKFRDNIFLKILIFFFFSFFIFRIPFSILGIENTIFYDRQVDEKQLETSITKLTIQYILLFFSIFLINPKTTQNKNIINTKLIDIIIFALIILVSFNLLFNIFGDVSYASYKKYFTVLNNVFNSLRLCLIFTIIIIYIFKNEIKIKNFYIKLFIFYSLYLIDTTLSGSRSGFFYILLVSFILLLNYFNLYKVKIKHLLLTPIIALILFLSFSVSTVFKAYKTYKSIDKPELYKLHINTNNIAPLTGILFETNKDWFIRFYKKNFFGNFQGISERTGFFDFYVEKISNYEKYYKDKINLNYYSKPVIDRLSPGVDIFNVPFASKTLHDKYYSTFNLENNKEYFSQHTNSEQITIFAESEALFGNFSLIYYCMIFLILKLFFYLTRNSKTLLKDLINGIILVSYFDWLTCFGLDMFVVLTIYKISVIIIIYYFCIFYQFFKSVIR